MLVAGFRRGAATPKGRWCGFCPGLRPPFVMLRQLDQMVFQYLEKVDRRDLVYPACERTPEDVAGDIRAIWEHTRLEAARYLTLIPGRDEALLVDPSRQPDILDALLRLRAHDEVVVDFTPSSTKNVAIAIIAGLNWLYNCAGIAKVDRKAFSGMHRNFRKIVSLAQKWWTTEGAVARYTELLAAGERPPLLLSLVWMEYTRLAKKVAYAAVIGPILTQTAERPGSVRGGVAQRDRLGPVLQDLEVRMKRFEAAIDPENFVDKS
jgi:hypothetical protein